MSGHTLALCAVAAVLAGCSSSGPAASDGKRTLEVWTAESGTRLELVRKRADAFMAAHADVSVHLTVRDFGSYPAQLKLALASDNAPDVAIGNLGWSLDGPLIKAGLLRELSPWVKRYGWDTRYSADVQRQMRFTADGREFGRGAIFGIPYAADVIGWFYNVGKLKALKLEIPTTFAELENAMVRAKSAGELPMMLGNKPQWPGLHVFYLISDNLANAKEITGIVFGDTTASWSTASFVASATRLANWNARGFFPAGANGMAPVDANARFTRGQGVFLPAGSWNAAELSAAMADNVGFFLTPPNRVGEPQRATGSIGFGWHITTASRQADLAAEFIDFMTNEDWARELIAAGDIAPFAVPGATSAAAKLTNDILAIWQSVLSNNLLLPYLDSSTPNGSEVIYPTMQSILAGQQSAADGLTEIEKARQKFLATR